ncbi:hypothetical protein OC842_007150 [Tilletia horrida]|uniref:Uncharacterized protein n=1 Tax=Tilletia horrida TaxID=155126 RepID=A0AAN6G5Z7_9BASI|nr:hypothetical protein OC842_007150 [Tilletia horrida]KAK0559460.1 hypothetical protein OC844_004386 [Tilletia horrida]
MSSTINTNTAARAVRGHAFTLYDSRGRTAFLDWTNYNASMPFDLSHYEGNVERDIWYPFKIRLLEPNIQPLLARLREISDYIGKHNGKYHKHDSMLRHILVDEVVRPLLPNEPWERVMRNRLPPAWHRQQAELQALGLIEQVDEAKMDRDAESTLSLKLSALPEGVRKVIQDSGLLGPDGQSIPLITTAAIWDPELYILTDHPHEQVCAVGLPTLRLLRSIQHRINPAIKAPVYAATLLFTRSSMICYLHILEPDSRRPVHTSIMYEKTCESNLCIIGIIQQLKNKLHKALAHSFGTTSSAKAMLLMQQINSKALNTMTAAIAYSTGRNPSPSSPEPVDEWVAKGIEDSSHQECGAQQEMGARTLKGDAHNIQDDLDDFEEVGDQSTLSNGSDDTSTAALQVHHRSPPSRTGWCSR